MLFEEIREALSQIRSNTYSVFTAVGIISIILLVFGMYLLTIYNINILVENLKKDMQVIAYFDKGVSSGEIEGIKKDIEGFKEVESVIYISRDNALEMLSRDVTNVRDIVKELKGNPLPDSFRIVLRPDARTPEGIKKIAENLKGMSSVEDVEYGKEWVEKLNVFISTARVVGVVVGGIMVLIVLFIISNTVKFTLLTRREEIEIMKYAGATNLFIKIPFVIEGGILGFISGVSSLVMLFLSYKLILYKIPAATYVWLGGLKFVFIPPEAIILIICIGVILGCFGSWVSIGRYLTVAIFLFLCLNVTDVSFAKTKGSPSSEGHNIEKEIEQNQKKLEDLNKQIKEKKKASTQAVVEEKKVKKVIDVKEKDLDSKKKELMRVRNDLIQKEKEINSTRDDMNDMTANLLKKKREMEEFLVYVYKSHTARTSGVIMNVLASEDYHDFVQRSKYEDILLGETNSIMKDLGDDIDKLNGQLSLMNKRHNTLIADKGKLLTDKKEIESEVQKSRVRLGAIQDKKEEYNKEIKRLERASYALKNLIESYEEKRSSNKVVSHSTGFGKEKGKLIWPLTGDVISRFGRQKHPEFDAYIFKKGIEISAKNESNFKAVYDGVVAYADWLQGYGLLTIIDHGNSYYSIYGHASKLFVSKGANVKEGQVIGVAGNSNTSDKEGIYFEIRQNGQPVDPFPWLNIKQ